MKKTLAKTQFLIGKNSSLDSMLFFVGSLIFAAFVIAGGAAAANAQNVLKGEWNAQTHTEKPDSLNITFIRRLIKNSIFQTDINAAFSELQGLAPRTISSGSPDVNFRIAGEAGTFEFEGLFKDGKGTGFWTLTPNQSFVTAMRNRGYDNLTIHDLFSATVSNLTTEYVEDLKSAGYGNLKYGTVLILRSNDVTADFISDIQSAGFENLTINQIIRAKSGNINSDFIRRAKAKGFTDLTLEQFVELRSQNLIK